HDKYPTNNLQHDLVDRGMAITIDSVTHSNFPEKKSICSNSHSEIIIEQIGMEEAG
ncbi:hypothetical protein ACJMK2_009970, partial [Sinanodonta woodiana]